MQSSSTSIHIPRTHTQLTKWPWWSPAELVSNNTTTADDHPTPTCLNPCEQPLRTVGMGRPDPSSPQSTAAQGQRVTPPAGTSDGHLLPHWSPAWWWETPLCNTHIVSLAGSLFAQHHRYDSFLSRPNDSRCLNRLRWSASMGGKRLNLALLNGGRWCQHLLPVGRLRGLTCGGPPSRRRTGHIGTCCHLPGSRTMKTCKSQRRRVGMGGARV